MLYEKVVIKQAVEDNMLIIIMNNYIMNIPAKHAKEIYVNLIKTVAKWQRGYY